jgi:NAD(P)-dependent dehydrogenase (short-subunit alcohol dehydrogenase family)
MKILVTGSSGHLGEALVRTLRESEHDVVALDILGGPFTTEVGSIADRVPARDDALALRLARTGSTSGQPVSGDVHPYRLRRRSTAGINGRRGRASILPPPAMPDFPRSRHNWDWKLCMGLFEITVRDSALIA